MMLELAKLSEQELAKRNLVYQRSIRSLLQKLKQQDGKVTGAKQGQHELEATVIELQDRLSDLEVVLHEKDYEREALEERYRGLRREVDDWKAASEEAGALLRTALVEAKESLAQGVLRAHEAARAEPSPRASSPVKSAAEVAAQPEALPPQKAGAAAAAPAGRSAPVAAAAPAGKSAPAPAAPAAAAVPAGREAEGAAEEPASPPPRLHPLIAKAEQGLQATLEHTAEDNRPEDIPMQWLLARVDPEARERAALQMLDKLQQALAAAPSIPSTLSIPYSAGYDGSLRPLSGSMPAERPSAGASAGRNTGSQGRGKGEVRRVPQVGGGLPATRRLDWRQPGLYRRLWIPRSPSHQSARARKGTCPATCPSPRATSSRSGRQNTPGSRS